MIDVPTSRCFIVAQWIIASICFRYEHELVCLVVIVSHCSFPTMDSENESLNTSV